MAAVRKRPRRTSDYVTTKDQIRMLKVANSKLLVANGLQKERLARLGGLVPKREYVALEEKS